MNPLNAKFKRRGFMGVVGGSCAVITTAVLAQKHERPPEGGQRPPMPPGGRGTPAKKEKAVEGTIRQMAADVLVVGGGMAGVFAAVKAHDAGAKVLLVDKGAVGKSGQTPFARAIFRYEEGEACLTKAEYLKGTAEAAEYMNNPVYTRLLLDHSAERVDELESWGFFKEANYAKALNKPLKDRNIPIVERVALTNLLKDGDRVVGAMGLYIDKNESLVIHAKSVILCTGASGFKPSGWQIGGLTSDGDAMAYRVGAEITGKEWVDGHSRTNPGLGSLGDILSVDSAQIVGQLSIDENVEVSKNGPSSGGMMGPPGGGGGPGRSSSERGEHRGAPPGGDRMAGGPGGPPGGGGGGKSGPGGPPGGKGGGIMPVSMGGASAGMSQHKAEGLFPQDDKCSSNVPGLYAAGDALGSMQNGGVYTQGGSALAGSAVQGAIAGKTAAEFCQGVSMVKTPGSMLKKINTEIYAPLLRDRGFSPQWVTQTLQGVMIPNFILYVKSEERLLAALSYIEYLRDHQVPLLKADDLHELRQCHETANMILNAEMKLRAALMRKESRGSHYRDDYPEANDADWLCWIKIKQADDGSMALLKHPIAKS
ncbi:FAD-dependent oxidoreductase [Pontiella sulfatireligans]|uniref:Fumarate reductase flavoprotein subunit n=1 Tax=Pontiella sulfatireligans TaxID=2750658 RepID=A0A6C2UJB7_9BACT|nr:FAD-binding protein [Pontiella sulfatireligans]VGO20322.1 Fumarate reductase flavoprotein subunit [Pontiella sulfatireligans]